jgi:hypothetical protein
MPNWCDNTLTLTHDDPKMIHRAVKAFGQGKLLNEFIPVPDALTETMSGSYGDDDKQQDLEAQQESNRQKYGYATWYDFCVGEWGTKWDVGGADDFTEQIDKNNVRFCFQSAWAPPVDAYSKLESLGFTVDAFYHEPGMAFCGRYSDGYDETYEYGSMTANDIEAEVPNDINEMFGISDSVREFENESDE